MDVADKGKLYHLAATIGPVVGAAPLDEDLERHALALQIERKGKPSLAVAASAYHDDVIGLFLDPDAAQAGLLAARVLVHERADDLRAGRVLTLVAGAPGSRSVRGGSGAFALLDAKALGLPPWISVVAVGVPAPICEWEKATADEVRSAVPDLVTRFPKPRRAKDAPHSQPPTSGAPKTVLRRR